MNPRLKFHRRFRDATGAVIDEWLGKAAPCLAPKPAPSPFDPFAAMVVELEEAIQREAEQQRRQLEMGDVPWE